LATILLIDDHSETCEALRRLFGRSGHVACVGSGERALDSIREVRPAVVLLDYMMPGMDGMDVLARLRADPDPAVARTPVAMYTAVTDPAVRDRALAAGADEYVVKGLGFRELVAKIGRFLG
jgi:DNA-binding response OmpR family regulator